MIEGGWTIRPFPEFEHPPPARDMPQSFDHTLKYLMETWPEDWLRLLGLPASGAIEPVEAELPTLAVQSDRMFRVSGPPAFVAHLEPQSSRDDDLPERIFVYNTLTHRREQLPVVSHAILLRPEADGPRMTGVVERHDPEGRCYLRFEYRVVRIWEIPLEMILAGGPGVWPLAPLARGAKSRLEEVVHDLKEHVEAAPPARQGELWTAAFVLTGLLDKPEFGAALMRGVKRMKDSVTYQEILAEGEQKGLVKGRVEGRVEALQEMVIELGERSFGAPPASIKSRVRRIHDEERLRRMLVEMATVSNWKDLFAVR